MGRTREGTMSRTESPDFDRLAEARQIVSEAREDREAIKRLAAALRMVLENMGGHQHWDSFGTAGANCPICLNQEEAARQAREALHSVEVPAKPLDPFVGLRMPVGIILDWYETVPHGNDDVRHAVEIVKRMMRIPRL